MDGYSVKDAASVLGIPKRRVWELIARGVLAGAPEGDGGMRVFLQPHPGRPSPLTSDRDEQPRTNGNGGAHAEPSGEGSPFREILTEFRSLTERYGQALLALGEARGEVAALRSRVDLLEARLDLRLPGPRASSSVAWSMPEYTPPAPVETSIPEDGAPLEANAPTEAAASMAAFEPPEAFAPLGAGAHVEATEPPEPVAFPEAVASPEAVAHAEAVEPEELAFQADTQDDRQQQDEPARPAPEPARKRPDKGASRRRRALRGHSAIAGIAEALARAQDPTLADLPGAREAAEALAALQREVEARSAAVAQEAELEPEASAGTVAESSSDLDAVEDAFVEPAVATLAQDLVGEESLPDEQPDDMGIEALPEVAVEPARGEEPAAATPLDLGVPATVAEPAAETEGPSSEASMAEPQLTEPERASDEVPSPYTTDVVEPDWFADGDFTWLEAAQAESATQEIAPVEAEGPEEKESDQAIADAEEPGAVEDAEEAEVEHATVGEEPAPAEAEEAEVEHGTGEDDDATGELEQRADASGEHEDVDADHAPAAEAIQDAFEPDLEGAVPEREPMAVATLEPEFEEPQPSAAGPIQDAFEGIDVVARDPEPEVEAATEAIQGAFETPPDVTAATASPSEAAFTPLDMAVFAVDRPEPEARLTLSEPPASPPARAERRRRLTFRAAVQPTAPPPAAPAAEPPAEEELMWLGDEFEAAGLEIATTGWRGEPEAAIELPHRASAQEMSDSDLEQLAQDEGWETDEVDAIRTLLGRSVPEQATQSSGSIAVGPSALPDDVHPMDEVSAADEEPDDEPPAVEGTQPQPVLPVDEWPIHEPEPQGAEQLVPEITLDAVATPDPPRYGNAAELAAGAPNLDAATRTTQEVDPVHASVVARPVERRISTTEPDWLRRRRGPAAQAYRRLRRLLPG